MNASSLSFKAAVVFAIAGMTMGIVMAASQDFAAMPAHAHLNLLGWVSLFLIGFYYRLHPELDFSPWAWIQSWVWIFGTAVLTIGVAALHMGHKFGEPVAAVGSIIMLAAMVGFAVLVFRTASGKGGARNYAAAE